MKRHASMNRIYRLVWSQILNAWVPAAEIARGRSKGSSRRLFAAALSLTAAVGQAEPIGGQVISGRRQHQPVRHYHHDQPIQSEPVGQLAEFQHRPAGNSQLPAAQYGRHRSQPHRRHQRHANPRPPERQRPSVFD